MPMDYDIGGRSGSFVHAATALLRDLHDWARMLMAKEAMKMGKAGETFYSPDVSPLAVPQILDQKELDAAFGDVKHYSEAIGESAAAVNEAICGFHSQLTSIAAVATRTAYTYKEVYSHHESQWSCEEITRRRHASEQQIRILTEQVAIMQVAVRRIFMQVQLIHVCPPHPCDDGTTYVAEESGTELNTRQASSAKRPGGK